MEFLFGTDSFRSKCSNKSFSHTSLTYRLSSLLKRIRLFATGCTWSQFGGSIANFELSTARNGFNQLLANFHRHRSAASCHIKQCGHLDFVRLNVGQHIDDQCGRGQQMGRLVGVDCIQQLGGVVLDVWNHCGRKMKVELESQTRLQNLPS